MLHRSFILSFLFFTLLHVSMAGRYIYELKRHFGNPSCFSNWQTNLYEKYIDWSILRCLLEKPLPGITGKVRIQLFEDLGTRVAKTRLSSSDSVSGGWSHHSAWSSLAWRVILATVERNTGESNLAQTIFELFFPVSDSQKNSWSLNSVISGQLSWPSLDWVNCRVAWGHAHSYRSHTAGFKITKKESKLGCEEVPTDVTKLKSSQKIGNCLDAARSSGLSTDDVFMAGHR